MDARLIEKLRRDQSLRELPDGREGIDVTLQFVGAVPAAPRPQRKAWLRGRFIDLQRQVHDCLDLKPESLSVAAQSIEATVPVDTFDEICERLSHEDVRVAVVRSVQVVDQQE